MTLLLPKTVPVLLALVVTAGLAMPPVATACDTGSESAPAAKTKKR
jgi:hypothetical protein